MKKEYIKPTSETVSFFPEGQMMAGSRDISDISDETVDNEADMKSNHQGFGKGLWD